MEERSERGFWIGIIGSVVLHLGVFGYLMVAANSANSSPRPKIDAVTAVLVREGKPRDRKLLPRIYKSAPAPSRRTRPSKRDPKIKPRKWRPRRRRLTAKQLMERASRRLQRMRSKLNQEENDHPAAEIGERSGIRGGAKQGVADPSLARKGLMYGHKLRVKIENNMRIPSIFSDKQVARYKRRIRIDVTINRNGRLVKADISRSSGNPRFDNAALLGVKRASPFPRPPSDIWKLISDGIEIRWRS